MKSIAEFFRIKLHPNKQIHLDTLYKTDEECKKEYLTRLISKSKTFIEYNKDFKNEHNFIELSDVDDQYIFGILGKSSVIKQSPLRRIKDIKGKEIDEDNLSLEDYRYFLFDTHTLKCIVIKNSTAPAFKNLFRSFLMEFNNSLLNNISVNPIIDKNLNSKFKKFNEILKVNLIFDDESYLSSQINSLKNTLYLSNETTKKVNISLTMRNQKVNKEMVQLIEDNEFIQGEFEKFEIQGLSNDEKRETIEFVSRLLTKNIEVDLSDEALIDGEKYLNEIKNALIKGL